MFLAFVVVLAASSPGATRVCVAELEARRGALLAAQPKELLVVPSRVGFSGLTDHAFVQDPGFTYVTGLRAATGAVVVLDGPAQEAVLFLPSSLGPFADAVGLRSPEAASASAATGIASVQDAAALVPFLRTRLAAGAAGIRLASGGYDERLRANGAGFRESLRDSLAAALPGTTIADDAALATRRAVKSSFEIDRLREAGAASAKALLAGLRALGTGVRQRGVEAAIVSTCLTEAEGPSFWPWALSGASGAYPGPWQAFLDPNHLDAMPKAGETVRVDIGCASGGYMGDVGRTAPANGRFSDGQRETWELLVAAYRAGLGKVKAGVRSADVIAASLEEIRRRSLALKTPMARSAAEELTRPGGARHWQIHGIGLDAAEAPGGPDDVLEAGMVVDYEPIFVAEGQGFYLEDMLAVTADGYELLTPGLPYSAAEIEAAMGR
jgi:Xaa-Pro aminopeptidase